MSDSVVSVIQAESVRERDLDHLLMEEFYSDEEFREWFLAHIPMFRPAVAATLAAYRADRRSLDQRETDLRFDFRDLRDKVYACLLVENKVQARFQPGQALSYQNEVNALRRELGAHNAAAVLVAPASYGSLDDANAFDAVILIEDVIAKFERKLEVASDACLVRRLEIKLGLLRRLIARGSARRTRLGSGEQTWEPIAVSKKRVFSGRYDELLGELAPGFRLSVSSEGPNARTKSFSEFPGMRDVNFPVALRHEFGRPTMEKTKYVNLQFKGKAGKLDELAANRELFMDRSIYLAVAGGALAVRIDTPSIEADGERFPEQREKVIEGITAAKRLVDWMKTYSERLNEILK
jgi:hypothetical protein